MQQEQADLTRRSFMKGTGVAALGGGLFFSGAVSPKLVKDAAAALEATGASWPLPGPQRLSDTTRVLAQRAIGGEHGSAMANATFGFAPQDVAGLSSDMKYARATMLCAEQAPLRVLPGEKIVGAASLREGPYHLTPVAGGLSTSHVTIGFDKLLRVGYSGLRDELDAASSADDGMHCQTGPGRFGAALNGKGDGSVYVQGRSHTQYDTPPLSVECGTKLNSATGFNILVANRTKDSRYHWEIYSAAGSGNLCAYLPGYAPAVLDSGLSITDGQWHQVAMSFDGNTLAMWVDGAKRAEAALTASGSLGEGSGSLWIGAYPPDLIGCDGLVDDVRVSNSTRDFSVIPSGPLTVEADTLSLWPLDEAVTDTVHRDLGALNNASFPVVAGVSLAPGCKTTTGHFGRALDTDGSATNWAVAEGHDTYDEPPLTVECWAKLNAKTGFNIIVANRRKESRHHWELYTLPDSGWPSVYLPDYGANLVAEVDVCDGAWHYLAMVFTATNLKLYVDGVLRTNQTISRVGSLPEDGGTLDIGRYSASGIGCSGLIEEVRVSNVARTISGSPSGPLPVDGNTVALWRFNENDSDAYYRDESAIANHAWRPASGVAGNTLTAMRLCLEAAGVWHQRYLDLLDERIATASGDDLATYQKVRSALANVPENPPTTFHEAVQALWFGYAFQRLMGNWLGIGRIDWMLGPYLEADLAAGRTTLDEARETLAHFWIKGCEWIGVFDRVGSGDAQHYQNILLAGVDSDGNEVTNNVTYLVLDIVEELHISDFPIAVRLNRNTPEKLLRRIAEVQRHGGGIVAVYNEEVAIQSLVDFGYPLAEARKFTNDGCWELLIPGKSTFSYSPFDMLAMLHEILGLQTTGSAPNYATFNDLYTTFLARLQTHVDWFNTAADSAWASQHPAPLVSLLVDSCIANGRGYNDRGADYNCLALHAGGMPNAANSLLVLKKWVYDEKRLTLPQFVSILRDNWSGSEAMRQEVLSSFHFYGNDNNEADAMMQKVFNDYADMVWAVTERNGVKRPCGISTFGREIEFSHQGRRASPDGHLLGEILATNFSPSPSTDKKGPTAAMKSYCKMDFTRTPNCATIELKVHPSSVEGETGVDALAALMRSFVQLGGMFMHIDVVDSEMLRDAQLHPENYPNLSVRVAGWSARFATLNSEWQNMVINRTQQYFQPPSTTTAEGSRFYGGFLARRSRTLGLKGARRKERATG